MSPHSIALIHRMLLGVFDQKVNEGALEYACPRGQQLHEHVEVDAIAGDE